MNHLYVREHSTKPKEGSMEYFHSQFGSLIQYRKPSDWPTLRTMRVDAK